MLVEGVFFCGRNPIVTDDGDVMMAMRWKLVLRHAKRRRLRARGLENPFFMVSNPAPISSLPYPRSMLHSSSCSCFQRFAISSCKCRSVKRVRDWQKGYNCCEREPACSGVRNELMVRYHGEDAESNTLIIVQPCLIAQTDTHE